jgi:hypothetical protein
MDERTAINVGAAALVVVLLIVFYLIRGVRLRETKRRMGEFLAGYFNDGLPIDQLSRRARDVASWRFMGSSECQALVQAAFQRAAEAKLAGDAHSLEVEKKLLAALAAVSPSSDCRNGTRTRAGRPGGSRRPFLDASAA